MSAFHPKRTSAQSVDLGPIVHFAARAEADSAGRGTSHCGPSQKNDGQNDYYHWTSDEEAAPAPRFQSIEPPRPVSEIPELRSVGVFSFWAVSGHEHMLGAEVPAFHPLRTFAQAVFRRSGASAMPAVSRRLPEAAQPRPSRNRTEQQGEL